MDPEVFVQFTIVLLSLLFAPHIKDVVAAMVFGTLVTVLVITYLRHRDTILYTGYLVQKEANRRREQAAATGPMDSLFSLFGIPTYTPHDTSTATMEDITDLHEETDADAVEDRGEKPQEASE